MNPIVIEGYLVQSKLEHALQAIVGAGNWKGREVRLPTGRWRWDMSCQAGDRAMVVEFDGDEHYRNTLKIQVDEQKDRIAAEYGYHVVRIPYWVQLTTETLLHYFGLSANIHQDFPHGFITTKVFPASFCELGILRFEQELYSLPASVREAVVLSLRARANEHGAKYVIPTRLQNVL